MMEATGFYLLMIQKYINSKQNTRKKDYTLRSGDIEKDLTISNMTKQAEEKM